jgi:glutathione S-transferase
MTITLYHLRESPHARKVRLLAAELGIPLDLIDRDPRIGETRAPDYLALNPNGRVPTLKDGDFCLWESAAILKYLAAKAPERGLGGHDAASQALIDQWLFWWVGGPETGIDMLAWETLIKPRVLKQPGNDPGVIAEARARIDRFFPVLDRQLERRDYITGELSIADFAAGPRFDRAPALLKIDMAPYPAIQAWHERLRKRPYWETA